jgi:hypothetical protein
MTMAWISTDSLAIDKYIQSSVLISQLSPYLTRGGLTASPASLRTLVISAVLLSDFFSYPNLASRVRSFSRFESDAAPSTSEASAR